MRKTALLLAVTLIGLQGCNQPPDNAKVRAAIESRNKELGAAFAKGDAAAIAGMYSSSAQLFPPNGPTVGRDGVQKLWQQFIDGKFKALELTTTEVEACAD